MPDTGSTRLQLALTLCLLCLVVVLCWSQEEYYGGTLIIEDGRGGDIINPATADTLLERQIASLLFPRLLRHGSQGETDRSFILRMIPRRSEKILEIRLRNRETNPTGRLVTALDIISLLEQFLLDTARPSLWRSILLRIDGAAEFADGKVETIRGLAARDEFTLEIRFRNGRMLPLSMFADSALSITRDYVEPRYFSTGRGPFFREALGNYGANRQHAFGRPFIDRILLGEDNQTDRSSRNVSINMAATMVGAGEKSRDLVYPGRSCVYLAFNPESTLISTAGNRRYLASMLDVESLVSIFFKDTAEVMHRLIPDTYMPIEALSSSSGTAEATRFPTPLTIAYPENEPHMELIAERILVDLLVARVESQLVSYSDTPPEGSDLILTSALIHKDMPALGLWRMLHALFRKSSVMEGPWVDEVAWLLEMERRNTTEVLLVPLLDSEYGIDLPGALRGVKFFIDGTLDFEDAWLQPSMVQP